MDKDAQFLKRLLATFKVEAEEHLKGIISGLIELEKSGGAQGEEELVERVFREAHSLKGAARAVNLAEIESLCQAMESIFAAMKRQELKPSERLFDLLQETLDFLGRILPAADGERTHEEKTRQIELIRRLTGVSKGETADEETAKAGTGDVERGTREQTEIGEEARAAEAPQQVQGPRTPNLEPRTSNFEPVTPNPEPQTPIPVPRTSSPVPALAETVRVSTAKLSSVLLQAEEMLSAKLAAGQRALDLRGANTAFGAWKKEWAKVHPLFQELGQGARPTANGDRGAGNGELHRSLTKLFDFLEWNNTFVASLETRLKAEAKSAERDSRTLGGMVNNLLEEMKKVLMLPFSSLLEILPKLVRDLSRDGGKEVELVIRGDEIEIDRRILEEMKDPLVHLVRNCIDHGIEKPEERTQKGKPPHGTVTVAVAPKDSKVELTVRDDGVGISLGRVRAALLKAGSLPREKVENLTDQELLPYVFQSGVSTSPIITELSGRGLGLAIVREKVEKLGGTVSLETAPEAGTAFRIVLPLTVATFRGILVQVGEGIFVLPTMHVERAVRLKRTELKTVENRETIRVDGEPVSLVRLANVLELADRTTELPELIQAVLVCAAGTRIAFLVDEVMGEQEVLLKSFGRQLSRVRNVAGVTVLGSGMVVPILNAPDLLKSAVKAASFATAREAAAGVEEIAGRRPSVMVVEDSITTRSLLKNILETAGYSVATAVDGIDAFTRLKSEEFDIVVSDVDMPRMNGFDLTAKIRDDKGLTEMPVVLVTALASREDRERGVDVGANAYIVKSSFDQSNLLEVIRKLI